MLKTIIESLNKVKSEDIIIYDVNETSPLFSYVILASVDSERQASAVCDYLEDDLKQKGMSIKNIEGKNTKWVLVDCYDILVHVFEKEERAHFDLEKLYLNYKRVDIKNI